MSIQPFIGEIMMFASNFAPTGWALCDGQVMSIQQNQALFSLLGTTYGGNGVSTFALPDLRSRIPVGVSTNTQWGETGGLEQVSLSPNELPNHSHPFMASQAAATAGIPNGNTVADVSPTLMYRGAANANLVALGPSAIEGVGQSLPHENRMPFLVITYVIAIQGIFPPRG